MAKAVVKSSQEMGSFELRLVNSRTRMMRVTEKQKHQENMHHDQNENHVWPLDATKLKVTHVKMTANILKIPTGTVSVLKSSVTMLTVILP